MTQDEIIEMAKEADAYADAMDVGGKCYIGLRDQYFAKLVDAKATAKEREACANINFRIHLGLSSDQCYGVSELIRARGTEA